jgi:hypothetical protein
MTAPMVLDGPMNGAAFLAYVQQVLVPELDFRGVPKSDSRLAAQLRAYSLT